MIIASHVIFTAYGFWLPNDPRGSWSDFVGSWELFRFGPVVKLDEGERRSNAHLPHDSKKRLAAKQALRNPPVSFSAEQTSAIARGFADYVARARLVVWACSILPEHVHIMLERHRLDVEQIVIGLKGQATRCLLGAGIHPFQVQWDRKKPPPKCWARGEWKVFLDDADKIPEVIRYVEENPVKEGKPRQTWPFVSLFGSQTAIL